MPKPEMGFWTTLWVALGFKKPPPPPAYELVLQRELEEAKFDLLVAMAENERARYNVQMYKDRVERLAYDLGGQK